MFQFNIFRSVVFSTFFILLAQDGFCLELKSNVSYGQDQEQVLDIYIPESNGTSFSKVIVIVHGGSWSGGKKEDMNEFLGFLQTAFPTYLIANINYRLGNSSSPGFPKQVQDIDQALKFLESELQLNSSQFALFGGSAGAHLSMLYAYGFDKNQSVKAVVDVVGPVDLQDPLVSLNPLYNQMLFPLIGPYYYIQNSTIYKAASPVTYITPKAPPTIGFYGISDPLIPITQGPILKKKLGAVGVANDLNFYFGGHYFDWSPSDKQKMQTKIVNFLKLHF